ncbi:flavin monoamine oxidase family protein [Streptomyces sp. NPDC051217]|uniref:flavin monoamine oxidase family protein n=1 Tax=Streptomyces sp. NPDC051217 TaxID=3365644 RepID=UPI003795142C
MKNKTTDARHIAASRRAVLKSTGAAVLAASATGLGTTAARAATADATGPAAASYDVIIVGAGFAGVTAARELKEKGLRSLILEARNRVGGRTWTSEFAGHPVELGGAAVDAKQPNVWAEAKRYNIATVAPEGGLDNFILPTDSGFAVVPPADAVARIKPVFTRFFEEAQNLFPNPFDPFDREALLRDADKLSLRARLDQLRLTSAEEKLISGTTGGLSGGSSTRGAYTMLSQIWAMSGYTYEGYQGINTYGLQGGTVALLQAMLNDSGADLRLNTPVTRITEAGGSVTVTTKSGTTYTAPRVIMAVPVNVWKTIAFSPALPAEYTSVSSTGIGAPNVKKFFIRVTDNSAGAFVSQPAEGFPMCPIVSEGQFPDGSQLLLAFSTTPSFDATNLATVQSTLRQLVPGIKVLSTKVQNWGSDPYALGGWSMRTPGMLTGPYRTVQQPHGKIAFATSDIATGWSGYIDGAIESGIAAAEQTATRAAGARA